MTWIFSFILSGGLCIYARVSYGSSQSITLRGPPPSSRSSPRRIHPNGKIRPTSIQNRSVNAPIETQLVNDLKLTITIIILCADVVYIASYSYIVFRLWKNSKTKIGTGMNMNINRERGTFILCFLVAFIFVVFTAPYAVLRLNTNRNPMWTTALLITNSGVNSIVFFFREQQLICCAKKNKINNIINIVPIHPVQNKQHNKAWIWKQPKNCSLV